MPRFYCLQALAVGATIPLPDDVAHHVRVRRLAAGTPITLFNGAGGEYRASLCAIEKKSVTAQIEAFAPREAELPYALNLAQALPEAAKMDWIVEKAVELGVSAIEPLATQRCVTRLAGERADKRREHWQRIAIAACEQSGRNRVPTVGPVIGIEQWLTQPGTPLQRRILLSPRATTSLADWARDQAPQAISLLIGPEGGLSAAEEDAAQAHGALALALGARVLRTETAGLAALATLNALWDRSPVR